MTSFAEREPRTYFATVGRYKRMIAQADADGDIDRAARLRLSLAHYRITANSSYGIPRRDNPRTDPIR